MRLSLVGFFSAAALIHPAFCNLYEPPFHGTANRPGAQYIVTFKDAAAKENALFNLPTTARAMITHNWSIIPGFAGKFDTTTLSALRNTPSVKYIGEDFIVPFTTVKATRDQVVMSSPHGKFGPIQQNNASWGLARLAATTSLKGRDPNNQNFPYTYDSSAGLGVDIYVIDTGVRITHDDFGGRARWGASLVPSDPAPYKDVDGHGTTCASFAAGTRFGVAKNTNIIAVKIAPDGQHANGSVILTGVDWVSRAAAVSGRPSVASMSIGLHAFGPTPIDDAVNNLIAYGVHVALAVGNENLDVGHPPPLRLPLAIGVGASNINDARASFSNYGNIVDVFAPGEDVIGASHESDSAFWSQSGTSMSAPYVAGLLAHWISLHGNMHPRAMKAMARMSSLKNVLTGVPTGTVNYLAHKAL